MVVICRLVDLSDRIHVNRGYGNKEEFTGEEKLKP